MHIGFSFMNTPLDPDPRDLARVLEERGFESLWTGEHSHIPRCRTSPYPPGGQLPEPYRQMGDPYVTLMAAAVVTTTLKLGTGIALLMERELFSQAKTIASLDRLSGGRLMIGTGVGWNEEEFTNTTHQPWKKRYGVMRETVSATRTLWCDEAPEYHGEYINFDPVWFDPKPAQVGGPPVIFGAMGPLGVKHAAEWADGWMPVDVAMGDVAEGLRTFRERVSANGRDPDKVPITLQTLITPDLDTLKHYRDLGVARIVVGVAVDRWNQPEKIMPMVDEFGEFIHRLA